MVYRQERGHGICYNDPIVIVLRLTLLRRAVVLGCGLALAGAACLDLEPPASDVTLQIPNATATLIPTSTPTPPATVTPTSTVTATFTASPTITPMPSPTPPGPGLFPFGQTPFPLDPLPLPVPPGPGAPQPVSLGPISNWGCDGDERMEFVPPGPLVGEKMFIFVTAARDRQFGLMIGPQLSGVQGANVPGGGGLKKGWELTPALPGQYYYQFYGGPYPELLCVSALVEVTVGPGLIGFATPTPTATPRPAPTPLPPPRPDH